MNSGMVMECGKVVEYNPRQTGVLKSPGGLHLLGQVSSFEGVV